MDEKTTTALKHAVPETEFVKNTFSQTPKMTLVLSKSDNFALMCAHSCMTRQIILIFTQKVVN